MVGGHGPGPVAHPRPDRGMPQNLVAEHLDVLFGEVAPALRLPLR
jgi:hypothetical protein